VSNVKFGEDWDLLAVCDNVALCGLSTISPRDLIIDDPGQRNADPESGTLTLGSINVIQTALGG